MRSPSIRIASLDDDVLGEVTLAPLAHTGRSEAQLARAMSCRGPTPEQSRLPPSPPPAGPAPLSQRLAAVAALMRR